MDPVVSPRDWVEYAASRKNLSVDSISLGEVLVVTPIGIIYQKLIEFFKAYPWKNWIYDLEKQWGVKVADILGKKVSFMYIGVGAPQVAIIEEAVSIGVNKVVFTGLAGGLGVEIGDYVVPYEAICEDGYSQHYIPLGIPAESSPRLLKLMVKSCEETGHKPHIARVWTTSAPYREHYWKAEEYYTKWNCRAVEMETGAVYALAQYYNIEATALLIISDKIYLEKQLGFHHEKISKTIKQVPLILKKILLHLFTENTQQTSHQAK